MLELSEEKTEYIKTGEMDLLSQLLMKERKHVQEMEQIEKEREKIVDQTFRDLNITNEEKTVTVLLDHVKRDDEKRKLEEAVTELLQVIIELRRNEKLNQ